MEVWEEVGHFERLTNSSSSSTRVLYIPNLLFQRILQQLSAHSSSSPFSEKHALVTHTHTHTHLLFLSLSLSLSLSHAHTHTHKHAHAHTLPADTHVNKLFKKQKSSERHF